MKRKLLSILALLCLMVSGAWADGWNGETYTATTDEILESITVNDDATLTINQGVTVTVNGGINVTSGTLTVNGPGTLVVDGADGADGYDGDDGQDGGIGINGSGSIIIQGNAIVRVNGGNGGYSEIDNGGNGGAGITCSVTIYSGTLEVYGGEGGVSDYDNSGDGGAGITCSVTIYSGTLEVHGGEGGASYSGNGGNGGAGITCSVTIYSGTLEVYGGQGGSSDSGNGGNGANAFEGSGTLTYYGGNVNAIGGSYGNTYEGGEDGEDGNAFASTYNVDFKNEPTQILDQYDNVITADDMKIQKVYIEGEAAAPAPTVIASGNCGTSGHESEVTWVLTSDGVLTISGTGDMNDYSSYSKLPWKDYRSGSSATTLITSIVIEGGVTKIGNYAFYGCSNATSVSISNSVTSIGNYAFNSCTKLAMIDIPARVTSIGNNAFYNCTKLATIDIPNSVTSIGSTAFYNCKELETIDIPASVTTIGSNAFEKCSGLKSVSIPDRVTSINSSAFKDCSGLTSVSIPNGVTDISYRAFYRCTSLTSIDIPASITTIGSEAFYGCTSLTSINLYKLYTETNRLVLSSTNAFDNCHVDLKIHVFSDYVDAYKTAPTWSSIEDKITPISVTANPDGTGFYWATYYNDLANAKIPDDDTYTQVFKVALSGSTLTLTEISDRVINKGEGVILKSNLPSIDPESPSIPLASATTGTEAVGGYEGNSLTGTMTSITNPGNAYVLNKTATNGVGFYRLSSEGTIGAHKAYLTYTAGAREFFLFDDATGIEMPTVEGNDNADAVVYDLQGRRVAQPVKGLYIVNGKKYIKK